MLEHDWGTAGYNALLKIKKIYDFSGVMLAYILVIGDWAHIYNAWTWLFCYEIFKFAVNG